MTLLSGAVGNNIALNNAYAALFISSGAITSATVVSGGGIFISNGGMAVDTIVNSGTVQVSSGGRLCGSIQIHSGAVVSAYSGAAVDFTVTNRKTTDTYLINDLSRISGAPFYSITVKDDQEAGIYKLAQKADRFTGTVSIGNGTVDYGSITVNGQELICGSKVYSLNNSNGNLTLEISVIASFSNLQGDANGISWETSPGIFACTLAFSTNNFANSLLIDTNTSAADIYGMPAGTYQWGISDGANWFNGEDIVSDNTAAPQELVSDADGCLELFFAKASSIWEESFVAQHQGNSVWQGTREQLLLAGKNKLSDVFTGSEDANILVLTDDSNGDALFVEDIYTALGDQARFSQIDGIRAGAGDDIVDMTSQLYAYEGDGITIYGGAGNDIIWANKGSNTLFGDAGNDRIVGGSDDDKIIGGAGNDSMHGGGGEDIFYFGGNWGNDTVEQLEGGSVTLWFETSNGTWNEENLTYTDGTNTVTVKGTTDVELRFGAADVEGAFFPAASENIFEKNNKGFIA